MTPSITSDVVLNVSPVLFGNWSGVMMLNGVIIGCGGFDTRAVNAPPAPLKVLPCGVIVVEFAI
jgi:hypothetical protein